MTLEETIGAAVASQLAPTQEALRQLVAEVAAMRRALPPQLVSQTEAATILGISYSTVRRRVREGSLPYNRKLRKVDLTGLHAPAEARVAEKVLQLRRSSHG